MTQCTAKEFVIWRIVLKIKKNYLQKAITKEGYEAINDGQSSRGEEKKVIGNWQQQMQMVAFTLITMICFCRARPHAS